MAPSAIVTARDQVEEPGPLRDLQSTARSADPPQMGRVTWEESHRVAEHLRDPDKNIVCTPPAVTPEEQAHLDSLLDIEDLNEFVQMKIPRNFDESHILALVEKFRDGKEFSEEQVQALQHGFRRFLTFSFQANNSPATTINIVEMKDDVEDHTFERSMHRDRYLDLAEGAGEITTHWAITGTPLEYVRNEDIFRDKVDKWEQRSHRLKNRIMDAKFPFWKRRLQRQLDKHEREKKFLKEDFRTEAVDDGCMSAFRGKDAELNETKTPDKNSLLHFGGTGARLIIVGIPSSGDQPSGYEDLF